MELTLAASLFMSMCLNLLYTFSIFLLTSCSNTHAVQVKEFRDYSASYTVRGSRQGKEGQEEKIRKEEKKYREGGD